MCKLLFHHDISYYDIKKGKEYIIVCESDDFYYVQVDQKLIQMIPKGSEGFIYEYFD